MAIDRGVIDQQLQDLGEGSHWWDVRELRDLPAVLHPDEQVLALARGKVARGRWLRRTWLILLSDQRLLCMRSGSGTSWRQFEVPVRQVSRASLRVGPFKARVLVHAADRRYRFLVPPAEAYRLHAALSQVSSPSSVTAAGFRPARMVRQMLDHMLSLPGAALAPPARPVLPPPPPDLSPLEERLESLESHVEKLEQQVNFLEQLLQRRSRVGQGPQEDWESGTPMTGRDQ